ncbi:MAG: pyrimidine reductase family protein [Acidimicrobiaceae bacterium]|nr:pyrimidine reductase family protein [Acidimicrobiaceae bacterium]MYI53905.1 pyrimidine reductase family protein [Acidimicrobiaceae bacterium]MYJ80224.1 pyrimidine reductase family protein [Acidimicrobiaceae bacterium]
MRRLVPGPVTEVDPMELYPALPRPRPADRPWVMLNMISSADGATAVDGTSGALGSPADQAVVSAARACADWIVAAADTVRAERYGVPRTGAASRRARRAAGRADRPRLAVVSASLDLDLALPLFADQRPGDDLPVILTGRDAPTDAAERLESVAEVVRLASARPQPAEILAELERRGAAVVLSEGGPSFNAQLADAGLIDELCLSIAPLVAGGASTRIVHGSQKTVPLNLSIDHLLEASGTLFVRYVAEGAAATASSG